MASGISLVGLTVGVTGTNMEAMGVAGVVDAVATIVGTMAALGAVTEATAGQNMVASTMAAVVGAGMGTAEAVTLVLGSIPLVNSTITAEEAAMEAVTLAVGALTGADRMAVVDQ